MTYSPIDPLSLPEIGRYDEPPPRRVSVVVWVLLAVVVAVVALGWAWHPWAR